MAVLIPVLGIALVLAVADLMASAAWGQMPTENRSIEICADDRFKALAREGKLDLDPASGHGRDYDRAWLDCAGDPDQVIPQESEREAQAAIAPAGAPH